MLVSVNLTTKGAAPPVTFAEKSATGFAVCAASAIDDAKIKNRKTKAIEKGVVLKLKRNDVVYRR